MAPRNSFPPVRALIFDLDGTLIDTEDLYTLATNTILREFNRPDLPWSVKARLQGRPAPESGHIFREWAQLPISDEEYLRRMRKLQGDLFGQCRTLPGVEDLLRQAGEAAKLGLLEVAMATSSQTRNYELKVGHLQEEVVRFFPRECVVLGDDERIGEGRGKPCPDIYLLALRAVNERRRRMRVEIDGEVKPEECLVFEDSVLGVESARRAGMRVVWCPHPGLLQEYRGQENVVLAGRTWEFAEVDGMPGGAGEVGEVDDGWAEIIMTLEDFDFTKYGINLRDFEQRTESGLPAQPGTTETELEEMTARADGKRHSEAEGSRFKKERI